MGEVMNIIELAKQAGIADANFHAPHPGVIAQLERFADLVEAQEREACIKLVHEGTGEPIQTKTLFILKKERKRIEDAIRARGTT
jgi:hypothetical protein